MGRLTLASSLVTSVSLLGCGSVEDPGADPEDTTAPTITAVLPASGQIGLPADTAVKIFFSEKMDAASVEAAYASTDLPADAVFFIWNEANDELTITPKQPLALAEGIGNDPSVVTAKKYALALATTATDPSGNALETPLDYWMSTLKRMETDTVAIADLTRFRTSSGAVSAVGADLLIGDAGALSMRAFVSFDLVKLPGGVEIEKAAFGVKQAAVSGAPYTLGSLDPVHITYASVDATAWDAPAIATMLPLSTTASLGIRTVDVTSAVADDYANRAQRSNRTQFRLQFATSSNGDGTQDSVTLTTSTFGMLIHYLAP